MGDNLLPAMKTSLLIPFFLVLLVLLALVCLQRKASPSAGIIPVQRNIPYATQSPLQNLDLYLPPEAAEKPVPLIVWIHGGAWKLGEKDWITVKFLVDHGFALASIGYRFSQEAVFPAQIQDCNAALDFLLAHSKEYHFDPQQVIVGGGSAGGHLALLLGLARNKKAFGANSAFRPRGVLDFFGPSDLTRATEGITDPKMTEEIDGILRQLLGAPASRQDVSLPASPITYVAAGNPPVLLVHGEKDDMVPLAQSTTLHVALNQAGVKNVLLVIPGAGHDGPAFATPDVQKQILSFVTEVLAFPPAP
jgi:acetyl esterase/lipase